MWRGVHFFFDKNTCTRVEKEPSETGQTEISSGIFLGQSPLKPSIFWKTERDRFNRGSKEIALLRNIRLAQEGRKIIKTLTEV